MATKTPKYELQKKEDNDFYNIEDMNANWDKMEDALTEFDDSGTAEGITSFTDMLTKLVTGNKLAVTLRNLKAGLQFVLHTGSIVNNCVTDNAGLPLSAAQGKVLMDKYTQLYSEMTKINFSKQAYNTADIKDCNDIPVNNFVLAFSTAAHKPIQSQVFAIFCIGNAKDNLKAQYGFCISQSEPIYSRIWNPNTNWSDWIAMGK